MTPARRTERHVDDVETHGERLRLLVLRVEETTEDGLVEPNEYLLLRDVIAEALASYQPLPAGATCLDNGSRLLGMLARTMEVTPWVERVAREAAEDEADLLAA
jgi:hypothetical protein